MGNIQIKRMQRRLKSMKKIKKSMITNGRRFMSSNFGIGSTSHQIVRSMIEKNLRLEGLNFGISSSPHLASPSMKRQLPEVRMLVRTQSMEAVMQSTEQQQEKYRMLLEILSRLPVKSLLRFMYVCRNWKTLISSHPFRKLHRDKHISSPPSLITSYHSLEVYRKPFLQDQDQDQDTGAYTYLVTSDLEGKIFEKTKVPVSSVQDFYMRTPSYQSKLLCFHSFDSDEIYLYNPSTRQSFLLTNPSSFSSPEFQQHYNVALGYIPSKDEYVMVHLVKLKNGKLVCEVLSISISNDNFKLHYNQWRSIEVGIILRSVVGPGVFSGGAFYWKAIVQDSRDNIILSLDVETGCFSTFGLPKDNVMFHAALMELNGDLYLANYPERPAILTLWKLSSDNKLWIPYWEFDFGRLFQFTRGSRGGSSGFRFELFIYRLKYLKGYDCQPEDCQVSAEMGELRNGWGDGVPAWSAAATHTNLFTL